MSGALWKRAAVAALVLGAAGLPRAEAQVSGGASRVVQPPLNRPDLGAMHQRRQQFHMNLRHFLKENPQARRLFTPRVVVTPPLSNTYMPMYGNGGYGYGGYGYGHANQYEDQQPQTSVPAPAGQEKNPEQAKALAATGVVNQDGKVEWPLGLKILPGEEVGRLRNQVGAMFQVLADQMVQGTVNPALPGEITQAVDRLAALLQRDRTARQSLTSANLYDESSRFLNKMREATRLAVAVQPAGDSNPYLSSQTAGGVSSPAQPALLAGKNPY